MITDFHILHQNIEPNLQEIGKPSQEQTDSWNVQSKASHIVLDGNDIYYRAPLQEVDWRQVRAGWSSPLQRPRCLIHHQHCTPGAGAVVQSTRVQLHLKYMARHAAPPPLPAASKVQAKGSSKYKHPTREKERQCGLFLIS